MRFASCKLPIAWVPAVVAVLMLCASARTLAEPSATAGHDGGRPSEVGQSVGEPRIALPVAVGFGMVLSLFGLLGLVRRGRRRALRRMDAWDLENDTAHDRSLDLGSARDDG